MPDPSETELIDFSGWTLRIRITEARLPRLMLLIHGWTGDENSMWVFARHLPRDYWIVAPRAPHPTKPKGFSWRVRSAVQGSGPQVSDLQPVVNGLLSVLDAFATERGLAGHPWNLMGFSQGAALAATFALLHPERVERLALLAGFLPPGAEGLAAALPLRAKKIYVAHGSLDDTVDIELGRHAVRVLESAGATVLLCEGPVGHKVSADCLRQLMSFFA